MAKFPARFRGIGPSWRPVVALLCTTLLLPGEGVLLAQQAAPAAAAEKPAPKIPPEQLDSLVAPVALYSDPLLAQVLVAATYPLEIIQLQQWLMKNKGLKDKALTDAVGKQPWDPAIQSMSAFPDAVKRLSDDISWTTDLGNAFLAQQKDVMDAVQRMRKKAVDKGALKTNEQQKVETKVVETRTVIIVEPANPQVIYVPVYSPTVVYPPPVYPYPPIYYPPPPPPGAAFMTFTAGVMIGAAFSNGSCCNCGWGSSNNVNINVNNNYNKNTNVNANKNVNASGNNSWQHNSAHRGGAPYSNQATASKYGGTAQGSSSASRQASAQQASRQSGAGASPSASSASRSGGASPSASSSSAASRSGGAGASPSASASGSGGASKSSGALGGGSGGYSGSSANASSARGASSTSSSRGGGGGGGSRSGGGRKR